MTPLTRYTLVQVPGWIILGCLAGWALAQDWITASTATWIIVLWLLKDVALYPLCKPGFETGSANGAAGLVGRQAEVVSALTPRGQVRLDGERWTAYCPDAESTDGPDIGQLVYVRQSEGITLIVEATG